MTLKRNVIANYLGQGWVAIMGIGFIPIYVKYLGVEAYGLIGIFALMQSWLNLLDLGMTPALSREMALFKGGGHTTKSIKDLLRSIEIIGIGLALLIVVAMILASNWVVLSWLNVKELSIESAIHAFMLMSLVAALRFIENIYRSSMVGLGKQVALNVASIFIATLRGFGAVCVLVWVSPTIHAFFIWQAIVSALSVLILMFILYRVLPKSKDGGKFSWLSITKIQRYAGGMLVITVLSFLLMQTDKILLSKLLTLEAFGYYTIAALVANSLQLLAGPIDLAFFPRLTELVARKSDALLTTNFHLGSQLIAVIVGAAAIELIFFGDILLNLWTQNSVLTKEVAPLLVVLSIGTLFNALMHMPYQIQLAHGWASLTIKVNLIAVILLIPAIFFIAPRYGSIGVAWIWLFLNLCYLLFAVQFMFKKLLTTEKVNWYINDIVKPLLPATVLASVVRYIIPENLSDLGQFIVILLTSILIITISALTTPLVNKQIKSYMLNSLKPFIVRKFYRR